MQLRDRSSINAPRRHGESSGPVRPGRPVDQRPPFDPEFARRAAFPSLPLDYPGLGPAEQYRIERDQRRREETAAREAAEAGGAVEVGDEEDAEDHGEQDAHDEEDDDDNDDQDVLDEEQDVFGQGGFAPADERVAAMSVWRTPWPRPADEAEPAPWMRKLHQPGFPFFLEGLQDLDQLGVGQGDAEAEEQQEVAEEEEHEEEEVHAEEAEAEAEEARRSLTHDDPRARRREADQQFEEPGTQAFQVSSKLLRILARNNKLPQETNLTEPTTRPRIPSIPLPPPHHRHHPPPTSHLRFTHTATRTTITTKWPRDRPPTRALVAARRPPLVERSAAHGNRTTARSAARSTTGSCGSTRT